MRKIVYGIFTMLLALCCFGACKGGGDESSSLESVATESSSHSIEIAQSEVSLAAGESVQVEVTTSKKNVYVFWSIRDTHIATVSNTGVITGVSEGQTICYATFNGETVMCLVKVSAEVAEPMLSIVTPYQEGVTLKVGDTFNALWAAKLGDETLENATLNFEVSNADVVKIVDGQLVAKAAGEATVTAKVTYETQEASVSLTVNVVSAS